MRIALIASITPRDGVVQHITGTDVGEYVCAVTSELRRAINVRCRGADQSKQGDNLRTGNALLRGEQFAAKSIHANRGEPGASKTGAERVNRETQTTDTNEMNTELQSAQAALIYDYDCKVEKSKKTIKSELIELLDNSIRAGQELAEISNGKRIAWLRDNVPSITPEKCKAYLGIAATHAKRIDHTIDHRQLLMLGIIDGKQSEEDWRDNKDNAKPQWLAWAGKLCGFVNVTTKQRPLTEWTDTEKEVVRLQLKPIADFYRQLE